MFHNPYSQARWNIFWVFLVLLPIGPVRAQPVLDHLLESIPTIETGDANRYSLTDVSYAMGVDLDWNPLLRRAQLKDSQHGNLVTLVAGSNVGRVGPRMVRWSQAPSIQNGQIYISRELLVSVFERFPDFRPPGYEEPTEPTEDVIESFPGDTVSPGQPPGLFDGEPLKDIRNLLTVFYPPQGPIVSASPSLASATQILVDELEKTLVERGVSLKTVPWTPSDPDSTYLGSDALIAFRIQSSSPVAPTSFFIYEAGSGGAAPSTLTEWGRSDPALHRVCRDLAQSFNQSYIDEFGPSRSIGLRSGPLEILQGRTQPSVLVNLGVASTSAEAEIRRTARSLAAAITKEQEG